MPRREDIERFTQVLDSLGDEPAIRAARSQPIKAVPPPGEEQPAESGAEGPAPEAGPAEPGTGEQENLQDLFESLTAPAEAPAAEGEEEAPSIAEPSGAEIPGTAEGLDFASLFGEQTEPQAIEDIEKPVPSMPGAEDRAKRRPEKPPQEQAPDTGQPAPEEEGLMFPEGEPAGLQSDLSQMEVLPEDLGQTETQVGGEAIGAPEQAIPEAGAPEPGAASFEDLGSFALDASEEAKAPEPGGEAVELPNLEDLSFPAPSEAPTPGAGQPAFGEPSFEEPAAPESAAPESAEQAPPLEGFGPEAGGVLEAQPEPPGAAPFAVEPSGEAAPSEAPEMESPGEESLGDLSLEQFSLPESAEAFGAPQAQRPAPPPRRPAPPRAAPRPRPARPAPAAAEPEAAVEPEAAAGEIELTPEQFVQVKRTLQSLPRNLKIAVQDLIGQGTASDADLRALISLLLAGATAQEIATLAGRISGKRIRIPAGYEKKTGVAFEAEQRTFAYAFRENILPLLRVVVLTVFVGGILGFLGYSFIYRPLSAIANYRAGYAQIRNDRFTLANERFASAVGVWPMRRWFYRYAEAFAARQQYVLAENKYEDLLRRFPGDRKGTLDFARMETTQLANYQKADSLLAGMLDRRRYDYDALLATGDNDLAWADTAADKYEAARLAYATLIERYGAKDELLFRMLRYFMRTDNGDEVERLRAYYASRPDVRVDPAAYAELGGYLVDHRRLDYAQEVLFRADKVQPGLSEVHYNLARYYRIVQNPADEKKALDQTLLLLKASDPLTRKRLSIEIDTHTRLGEYYYDAKDYVGADRELRTAIRLVEQNQRMNLIGKDRQFGRPYAALGDLIYYIQGDLPAAALQYQNAIANLYTDPELTYKIGYTQYASEDYQSALASFTAAEEAVPYPSGNEALAPAAGIEAGLVSAPGQVPANLLFALGDCFFTRGDFFSAQGYFLQLLDRLNTRRTALGTLRPEESPEDRALLDYLVKVNNNLGVTMLRLSQRTGDQKRKTEAMVYLTSATEIADSLARSPDSVQRSETRSLPSLNMRGIVYPVTEFEPQIYRALPKDFKALSW